MMNCREILALLSDYIDEELDEGICQEIEGHMAECPGSCSAFTNTFRMTISLYQKSSVEEVPQEVHFHLRHLLWQRWESGD